MMAKLVEYNGMEYRNRKLVIEYHKSDKSTIPYGLQNVQQARIKKGSLRTFGFNRNMGDSRPTSSASSRQEESIPYVNRMEGELGDENPEVVGLVQVLFRMTEPWHTNLEINRIEHQLEEKKRCQLFIEVPNYHTGIPPSDAGLMYRTFTEVLGLSKDHNKQGVKAIYRQPNPQNLWNGWYCLCLKS